MSLDFRLDEAGAIDEIIAVRPEAVHLERLDAGAWWIEIRYADGRQVIHLYTPRNGKIHAMTEWEREAISEKTDR